MIEGKRLSKRLILLIITILCCERYLYGQGITHSLTRLTAADGLATSEISTLFQDSQHVLWIGHKAGITRYNGYSFENFLFAGEKRIGIVNAIAEEKDGTIWLGAEGGLFYYRKNRMVYVDLNKRPPAIYSIAINSHGDLFIGATDGLGVISSPLLKKLDDSRMETGWLRLQPAWYTKPGGFNNVKFISIASKDVIYISDGYSIIRYEGQTSKSIHTIINNRDYITGMVALGKDSIYLSSQINGFWMLLHQQVHRLGFSKGIGNALSFSRNRLLYFAVEGIYSVDYKTNVSNLLLRLPEHYQEWGSALLEDKEGNLWIGTHEELLFARPVMFNQSFYTTNDGLGELYSLHLDADGSILAGGNRGKIFRSDTQQSSFSLWKMVFPHAEVFDIHSTGNDDMWFCSGYQGVSLLRQGTITRFTIEDGLRSNSNYRFLTTTQGELFLCGDNGVTKIKDGPGTEVSFDNYKLNANQHGYTVISSMLETQHGEILFGSDQGLLVLKNDSLNSDTISGNLRRSPAITDMKQDKSGNVWISTVGDGILLCEFGTDGSLRLKKKFGVADGLFAAIYLQVFIDRSGIVWVIGNKEVTRIEQRSDNSFQISSFGRAHGFLDKGYHSARLLQDNKGIVWVATSSGLLNFDPKTLSRSLPPPAMMIDSVFAWNKNGRPKFSSDTISKFLELPYNFGSISFHFTGIYLTDPSAVRYAYRLQGSDSNWIETGSERTATFQNLPPGNYRFEAKGSLDGIIWSKTLSYDFGVATPYWYRWWFILLVALTFVALVLYIVLLRERMVERRETRKTEIEKLKAISYQYQLEIEKVVNYFATVISEHKNIDALLWDITRNCISKLGFEDCVIYLKNETSGMLTQKAAWGPKTSDENKILNPIQISMGKGIVGAVAVSGRPEIVTNTAYDARYIVDDQRRLSELAVPIISDGRVIGVIDSENSQPGFYTDMHLQILTTIAALCADKINKIRAEQQTKAKEIELMKLQNDLTTSQLVALRSQMNPHFIFNSLNSIAQLVASRQNELGLEYLNKFAALLRIILEESESDFIALGDEIKLLNLYLELESLRFGSSFFYAITIDPELDKETMLPSFIIHPIVENAIWHGLLHKEGERKLSIDFHKQNNEELLCVVKDNGIGFEAAKNMKKTLSGYGKQQSKGLSMVYNRLRILEKQYETLSSLLVEDLHNNGSASGTKVSIHLPIIHDS